jgi:hypothetical protein
MLPFDSMREAYLVIVSLLPNVVVDGLNVEVKLRVSLLFRFGNPWCGLLIPSCSKN